MDDFPPAGGSIRAVPVGRRACGVGENVTNAKGVAQQMSDPDDPVYRGACISSNVSERAPDQVHMARRPLASRRLILCLDLGHANSDVDKLTCHRVCLH